MGETHTNNQQVSIITPLYNAEKYIAQTIESVLNQTYTQWEMIIVDDGSTDNSKQIAETYAQTDQRIHIYVQTNQGAGAARNNGIRRSTGRYLAFLDADDLWESTFLENQLVFMKANNAQLVCGAHRRINENGQEILQPFYPPKQATYQDLLKTCSITCLTGLYDTQPYGKIFFEEERTLREDYIYWLNIIKKVGIVYGNQQIVGSYRIIHSSVSYNKRKMIVPQYSVYRTNEKLNIFKSLYYLCHWAWNGYTKYNK